MRAKPNRAAKYKPFKPAADGRGCLADHHAEGVDAEQLNDPSDDQAAECRPNRGRGNPRPGNLVCGRDPGTDGKTAKRGRKDVHRQHHEQEGRAPTAGRNGSGEAPSP